MGQMMKGSRPVGLIIDDVMDFSPAGLLGRMPSGALAMNAFHGTPHVFKPEPGFPQGRPRLDKMGIGEGSQHFGRGFYLTDTRLIANDYRNMNRTVGDFWQDLSAVTKLLPETYQGNTDNAERIFKQIEDALKKGEIATASDYLKIYEVPENLTSAYKEAGKLMDNFGSLYKFDVPDESAAKFFSFDAPFSRQSKAVQKAFTDAGFNPKNFATDFELASLTTLLKNQLKISATSANPTSLRQYVTTYVSPEIAARDFANANDIPFTAALRWAFKTAKKEGAAKSQQMSAGDLWAKMRQDLGEDGAVEAMRRRDVPGLSFNDGKSRNSVELLFEGKTITPNKAYDLALKESGLPKPEAETVARLVMRYAGGMTLRDTAREQDPMKMLQNEAKFLNATQDQIAEAGKIAKRMAAKPKSNNYVIWDQDVLDRTKVLQRNNETFKAVPGVPVMGLIEQPGGLDIMGQYTGGVI